MRYWRAAFVGVTVSVLAFGLFQLLQQRRWRRNGQSRKRPTCSHRCLGPSD